MINLILICRARATNDQYFGDVFIIARPLLTSRYGYVISYTCYGIVHILYATVDIALMRILKHLRQFVQSDWFLPVFISHDKRLALFYSSLSIVLSIIILDCT